MMTEKERIRYRELERKWIDNKASVEEIAELTELIDLSRRTKGEGFKDKTTERLAEILVYDMKKRRDFGEKIVGDIKREFTQIFREVVKQVEAYPIVFKAIVNKSGRITIPLAERKSGNIVSGTIVQVKMKLLTNEKH